MNDDTIAGKWKQMRGQVKEWWGKLTDDELDQAAGKSEQMIGAGYSPNRRSRAPLVDRGRVGLTA